MSPVSFKVCADCDKPAFQDGKRWRKRCSECQRFIKAKRQRDWRRANPERVRELNKKGQRQQERDKWNQWYREQYWPVRRARQYSLTLEELTALLEKQHRQCAVCRVDMGTTNWHVDHDHKCCPGKTSCGKCIRGILCNHCNLALGLVKDSISTLAALTAYLQRTVIVKS